MKVQTKYLGEAEIESSNIIKFAAGVPGFNEEKEFILMDIPGNDGFQILQSIKSANTAFIVTNPHQIYPDYTFDLDENTQNMLQIKSEKEVVVFTILTIKDPFQESTLNLKAPIIINPVSRLGKQYIINADHYPTRAKVSPKHSRQMEGE
ncbi:flagellar assembly protein FliW [Virgibacillus sp. YIM 98842]|uniref:flagellar assembly protein FliW n=1 Tax=Virgibacillus sp. YIM 98842 TaxID=2663533 RepID=UPI0013D96039|nr:flagellar assembly protein FliW [Virgibacillus sp. YIM 98842]